MRDRVWDWPSPRERRYPADQLPARDLRPALSARAEVPRRSPCRTATCGSPLRASGGTPPAQHSGRAATPPSPRERRYPGGVQRLRGRHRALSARAEVPRRWTAPRGSAGRPLRASGGTPTVVSSEIRRIGPSPRERRYPSIRSISGSLPSSSSRERRCPVVDGRQGRHGAVLSARAEVPRLRRRGGCRRRAPLRASGGTPAPRMPGAEGPSSSPRESAPHPRDTSNARPANGPSSNVCSTSAGCFPGLRRSPFDR